MNRRVNRDQYRTERQSYDYAMCFKAALFLILASGVFVGCHAYDRPSESDARQYLERRIDTAGHGLIRLHDFKKTDGKATEMFGVKEYRLRYEAEIEVMRDCCLEMGRVSEYLMLDAKEPPCSIYDQIGGFRSVQKGKLVKLEGVIVYEKSEQGWNKTFEGGPDSF